MISKHLFNKGIAVVVMTGMTSLVCAQSFTGSVVSTDSNLPIGGASIKVKNQTVATSSNESGKFSISAAKGAILIVSYVGYKTEEIPVTGVNMVIRLEPVTSDLDEVVVIGYGVQKKKLNTGANLKIEGEDLQKRNQVNPLQALQGQAPGVSITSTSGQPGADMKVVVRGLGTIGNSGPLYVIDGVPGGDIAVLNAADIQSIDVLKDAASAAIYGSQGANGVVLVTTKMGVSGKSVLSFDGYTGIQNVARKAKLLNADQYKVIMNEQSLNSGASLIDFDAMDGLTNTNWLDYMFKANAKTDNYSVGLTGGSEKSTYAMSLNYIAQEGIVGGKDVSNYERYGFRSNSEHKLLNNFLKIGQHLNFNYIKNRGISVGNQYSNTLRGAFATSPLSPVYSDNGLYGSPFNDTSNSPWYNGDSNPYGSMMTNSNNNNDGQKLLADIFAEIEPIKGLKVRSLLGFNYFASEYRSFTPMYRFSIYTYNQDHTTTSQNMSKGHTLTWTNTASYDFNVNTDHKFSAMVGMESLRYQGTYLSGSNWNLLSQFNDFAHAYLDNTTGQAHLDEKGNVVETRTVSGKPDNLQRRLSYFGRIGYNYKEKYLLNATLRADASSKFSSANRWGYFPSVSAGWVISSEDFFSEHLSAINFLKFRASWGQVGNQDIDDFQYAAPISTSTGVTSSNPGAHYVFGTANNNIAGAYPSRLSNPSLTWETSETDQYWVRC
ncbi:SusC/RagA family TonB-linked outer membrane protein [Sphingobacterium sp. SG20118]|uniref:SusC/RagA family TonB-linked outer membrane protein n=1 Tax=Sphingobacterium sp. SG20118 TaxID=3367156 RepID=UPI0037DFC45F